MDIDEFVIHISLKSWLPQSFDMYRLISILPIDLNYGFYWIALFFRRSTALLWIINVFYLLYYQGYSIYQFRQTFYAKKCVYILYDIRDFFFLYIRLSFYFSRLHWSAFPFSRSSGSLRWLIAMGFHRRPLIFSQELPGQSWPSFIWNVYRVKGREIVNFMTTHLKER